MKQSFESILTSILEEYEKDPMQDIDALINKKMQAFGISENGIQMLQETIEYLEAFDKQYTSLVAAKENGQSRKSWILRKMDGIMEGRTEQEKATIVSAISEAKERVINDNISQE